MTWQLEYLPEAIEDIDTLDNSIKKPVLKGIKKVQTNPVSKEDGGYGTPLGNKGGNNLSGLFKIKFKKFGIRVVYKLELADTVMKIIIVSAREENQVYDKAADRRHKYSL